VHHINSCIKHIKSFKIIKGLTRFGTLDLRITRTKYRTENLHLVGFESEFIRLRSWRSDHYTKFAHHNLQINIYKRVSSFFRSNNFSLRFGTRHSSVVLNRISVSKARAKARSKARTKAKLLCIQFFWCSRAFRTLLRALHQDRQFSKISLPLLRIEHASLGTVCKCFNH